MFLMTITFFFFIGGTFATLMRLELLTPDGDLFTAETYNKLFSMHGIIMVLFFLIPSIPDGARKFPDPDDDRRAGSRLSQLNLLSWYLFIIGGIFDAYAILAGGVDTGWTFYTPYSSHIRNTSRRRRVWSEFSSPASRRS